MESVASMDEVDKDIMSRSFGDLPWKCEARARLYWVTWELNAEDEGVDLRNRILDGDSPWEESVYKPGG